VIRSRIHLELPWLWLAAIAAASATAYRALERPPAGRDAVAGAELAYSGVE
jgi:hypothetical protein